MSVGEWLQVKCDHIGLEKHALAVAVLWRRNAERLHAELQDELKQLATNIDDVSEVLSRLDQGLE